MLRSLLTPIIAFALAASSAFAASISVSGTAPTVNDADIAMLNTTGEFDVAPGGDGGHIWSNRPVQGQTFATGSNALGYELSAITLRNLNNTNGGNSATWTVRVGTVSGTTFTPIASATSSNTISYAPGDYLTLNYGTTVILDPNTVYGFDWDTSGSGFVTANNSDTNYTGGQAFSSGGGGVPDDANLVYRASDRVFHVDLATNTKIHGGFGVNFIGGQSVPDSDGIVGAIDPAGAAQYAQRNWNEVAPRNGQVGSIAAGAVIDRHGDAIAGTTVSWTANNTWSSAAVAPASDDHALMKGYLDSNGAAGPVVTVNSVALDQYSVVVYLDGDGGNLSAKGQYWLEDNSGNVISNKVFLNEGHGGSAHFAGTYQEARTGANTVGTADAGNYIVFEGVTSTDFVLKGVQSGSRAPINAFQVFETGTEAIGINFQGGGSGGGATTAMQAQEIAGAVSQSNWNSVADNGTNAGGAAKAGNSNNLTDSFGNTTTADITWSANNTWSLTHADVAGDNRLMKGYLDNFHLSGSVTVSQIPYAIYDVYVYGDSDRPIGNETEFILNGLLSRFLTEGGDFDGYLEEGEDYVRFRGITGTSFTLTALLGANTGGAGPAAPLAGIQIVAIPAPAALPAGLSLIVFAAARRRRR